jgi:hypothetical protein
MDWDYVLNEILINSTDSFTHAKAYNICKNAAIVEYETGICLVATLDFKVILTSDYSFYQVNSKK